MDSPVRSAVDGAGAITCISGHEPHPAQLLALFERTLLGAGWHWQTDAQGRTQFVSDTFAAVAGCTPETALGVNEWREGRAMDPAMADRLALATQHREPFADIEYRQAGAPGRAMAWYVTSGVPAYDEEGGFCGYWGVTREISARKRVEAQLQTSEARYRQLAGATSDWVWRTNARHEITDVTEERVRPAARPSIGHCRWDLDGVDQPENDWVGHRATLEARQPFRGFEFARAHPDGSRRWVSISGAPYFNGAGVFLGYQGTGHYITERKLAEARLAQSEARYRRLATLSADWEWSSDAQHRLHYVSERALGLRQGSPVAWQGVRRWELPGVDLETNDWPEYRRTAEAREAVRNFEYARRTEAGGVHWTSLSADPVYDSRGVFQGYEGTGRDITAQKRAQQRLERLSRMYRALGDVERDLARVTNAQQAIAAVCELVYTMGGLRRATYFMHDAPAQILRVAHTAGEHSPVRQEWETAGAKYAEHAALPILRALHTGETQDTPDFQNDPDTARFHELARHVGIASALALPVRPHGEGGGVLGLYAAERNWFDADLVVLAQRIATSLAQALDALALRRAQQRAQRFYLALGSMSEAAQLATDEAQLFESACRTLRETGELHGVALYRPNPSATELVCTAYAGPPPAAHIALPDAQADPRVQLPSVAAWLTGQSQVVNDYLALETARAYHDHYGRQGVRASMLVPLKSANAQERPLLVLMAAQRNWFDDALQSLAERIAAVISHALGRLALERSKAATEAQLARSEAQHRQFVALTSDWHWETDIERRITHFSGNRAADFGSEPGSQIGRVLGNFPFDPPPEQSAAFWARLQAGENVRDFEMHLANLPGAPHWRVNAAPRLDAAGTLVGYCGTTRDVSAEVKAASALHDAEEQFNRLARLSVDWYWGTDAEGRITYLSPAYARNTGIDPETVLGVVAFQPPPADVCTEDAAGDLAIMAAIAARQPFFNIVHPRNQNAAPLAMRWRISSGEPVFDAEGTFQGYLGCARDVTREVQVQRTLAACLTCRPEVSRCPTARAGLAHGPL